MYLDNTFPSLTPPLVRPLVSALRRPLTSSIWTPAQLFANGEQGVWYEPKPEYLYQDAAGTTPVTADGDPVGLMLDRSRGLELGPELVTDGSFNDPEAWDLFGNATVSGGVASFPGGENSSVRQATSLSAGWYLVEFEKVSIQEFASGIRFYDADGSTLETKFTQAGMLSFYFYLSTAASFCGFVGGTSFEGSFDNLSIRELPGNHATQSTSAARSIYRTDGTLHWLEFDGVDDTLNSFLDPILSKTSPFFISMAATSDQTGFDRLLSIGAGSEEAIQILTQTDGYRAVLEINSTGINHGVKGRIAGMDVFTFGSDGDDTYITRIGGEVVANETDGGDALTGSAGVLTLGARNPSGQSACNMTFTGALMVQRSNGFKQAEPYLASLAGVTL